MRTVTFEGRECKGKVVEFTQDKPAQWVTLTAPDGSIIKVKVEVTELVRVVDEYYENGEPVFFVSWAMQQTVMGAEGAQKAITPKGKILQ